MALIFAKEDIHEKAHDPVIQAREILLWKVFGVNTIIYISLILIGYLYFHNSHKMESFDEVKIRHFGRNLISAVRAHFWGDRPHFFSCCPIIVYILGSYHALPLDPDFLVNLRVHMIPSPH